MKGDPAQDRPRVARGEVNAAALKNVWRGNKAGKKEDVVTYGSVGRADDPDRKLTKLNFYAESAPRAIWTKGQFAIDLGITIVDGVLKISGIREKLVHQQKGQPGSPPTNNAPRKSYAYGIPIQGKPGFVRSPCAPSKGEIDIRRYPKGAQLKCPFTGKIFIAP